MRAAAFLPGDAAFRSDPYPAYEALRRHSPAHFRTDRGDWVVSRYDDVASLLRDERTGLPAHAPANGPAEPAGGGFLQTREESRRLFGLCLHCRAPTEHARLRRLVMGAFSPRRVALRQERIQAAADRLLDPAVARGRIDVIGDLARPLALGTVADLLGIPEEMRAFFGRWGGELVHHLEVDPSAAGRERGLLAMMGLAPRLRDLASRPRAASAEDDLLSDMMSASANGFLSEDELVAHGVFLFFAGHITTQHLIGNGVLALLRHPEQMARLRAQPATIDGAVEEMLRYDTPAPALRRVALTDIAVGGRTIPRGEGMVLLLAAAHRDPAAFDQPDRFDITRTPNPHLGFGHDAHYCVGAALAKLEARIAIATLLRRCPTLALESEALAWEDTFVVRGLKSLPLVIG